MAKVGKGSLKAAPAPESLEVPMLLQGISICVGAGAEVVASRNFDLPVVGVPIMREGFTTETGLLYDDPDVSLRLA